MSTQHDGLGFCQGLRQGLRQQMRIVLPCLFLTGAILPAAANPQSQSLQVSSEAYSRSCVQQVAQVEVAQPEVESAIAICQQAVALTQITGDQKLEAYSLGNLGTLSLHQQDYQQALTYYQQVLVIAEGMNDPILKTKALIAIGTTHLNLEHSQLALSFYQQALTQAESSDDLPGMVIAHYNLGLAYDTMGQYQQSVDTYQNAATLAEQMGDPILETYALNKLKLANAALTQANPQAVRL